MNSTDSILLYKLSELLWDHYNLEHGIASHCRCLGCHSYKITTTDDDDKVIIIAEDEDLRIVIEEADKKIKGEQHGTK